MFDFNRCFELFASLVTLRCIAQKGGETNSKVQNLETLKCKCLTLALPQFNKIYLCKGKTGEKLLKQNQCLRSHNASDTIRKASDSMNKLKMFSYLSY